MIIVKQHYTYRSYFVLREKQSGILNNMTGKDLLSCGSGKK